MFHDRSLGRDLTWWRPASQLEVDFVLNREVAHERLADGRRQDLAPDPSRLRGPQASTTGTP